MAFRAGANDAATFYASLVGVKPSALPPSLSQAPIPAHMSVQLDTTASQPTSARATKRARLHIGSDVSDVSDIRSHTTLPLNQPPVPRPSAGPSMPSDSDKPTTSVVQGFRSGGCMQDIAVGLEVIPAALQSASQEVSTHPAAADSSLPVHANRSRSGPQHHATEQEQRLRLGCMSQQNNVASSSLHDQANQDVWHNKSSIPPTSTAAATPALQVRHANASTSHPQLPGNGTLNKLSHSESSAARPSTHVHYSIAKDNIGFKLLKQAGWEEGTGLGAAGTGRLKPVLPHQQTGNRGIGFEHGTSKATADRAAADSGQRASGSGERVGVSVRKIAGIVAAELKAEDLDTKVKRHLQVIRQEEADARGKAIQQYIFRAFNQPDASVTPAPLAGPTRLTATNPLL